MISPYLSLLEGYDYGIPVLTLADLILKLKNNNLQGSKNVY